MTEQAVRDFFGYRYDAWSYNLTLDQSRIIDKTVSNEVFAVKFVELVSRRAGDGELDIFCGYYKDNEKVQALFITFHPGMPIMLLNLDDLRARIVNSKEQNLPADQSEEAIKGWPN